MSLPSDDLASATEPKTPAPRVLSPSQVETFHLCQRKWAWRAIAKVEVEPHPSAARGTKIHAMLENYLATGETLPVSSPDLDEREHAQIAASGIQHLPAPQTAGMRLESRFKLVTPNGHHWMGIRDLLLPPESNKDNPGIPLVLDHKTCGSFDYIKTPDILLTDTQAMIYAKSAFQEWDVPKVELRWVYYRTKGTRASKRVSLTVLRQHVDDEFSKIDDNAKPILPIYQAGPHPLDLPANASACNAFGGCPYKKLCPDVRRTPSIGKADPSMSLFNKLPKPVVQAPVATPAVEVPAPSPNPVVVETGPGVTTSFTGNTFSKDGVTYHNWPVPADGEPVRINPPEYQPPPTAADLEAEKEEAKAKKASKGRPRGSKNKPKAEVEAAIPDAPETTLEVEAEVQTETIPVPPPTSADLRSGGYDLYVNCVPMGVAYTNVEILLEIAKEHVCAETNLPDYRLVEYGRGPGMLLASFKSLIDDGQVVGSVVLMTSQPEAGIIESTLISRANSYTRGL